MAFARFLNEVKYRECSVTPSDNLVTMKFKEETAPNTFGFDLFHHDEGVADIGGDTYHGFNTVYKVIDAYTFQLSNDGSVYVEPDIVITFVAGVGGTLDGITRQVVKDFSELKKVTPVPEENYKFVEWSPAIPKSGKVSANQTFTAVFEYVAPIEEVQSNKIAELNAICETSIEAGASILTNGEIEHFTYAKSTDQANIKELFDLATTTDMPQYYHADGKNCRPYSVEEVIAIYGACAFSKNYNETYFNQAKQYILTLENKDDVTAFAYGTELPEEYSTIIAASLANAQAVLLKKVESLDVDQEAILAMIEGGKTPVEEAEVVEE